MLEVDSISESFRLYIASSIPSADVDEVIKLFHHPYSLDSQKVRLALEERDIDYTSYHANPITGKYMDFSFFQLNPST